MPQFNFDPTAASATIEVLQKGDYEVIVGEGKPFLRDGEKGQNHGIMFPLKVASGIHEGKPLFYNAYMHTPGAFAFVKQFQMAVLGFDKNREGEDAFNNQFGSADWGYDTDTGTVGDAWRELFGKRVIVSADTQPHRDRPDELTQQLKGFRPVDASATL